MLLAVLCDSLNTHAADAKGQTKTCRGITAAGATAPEGLDDFDLADQVETFGDELRAENQAFAAVPLGLAAQGAKPALPWAFLKRVKIGTPSPWLDSRIVGWTRYQVALCDENQVMREMMGERKAG